MTIQIVQQRAVGHRHAGGEAGRTAGILQIADIVGAGGGQGAIGRRPLREILPALRRAALPGGSRFGHFGDFVRVEQDPGVRAQKLHRQLVDIAFLAAEGGRQGQRHRPCPGIDAGAEQRGKVGPGFRDQRDPVFLADPGGDQTARHRQRILAHFGIGVDPRQFAAHVMEIKALAAFRGIVDRVVEGCKLRTDSWQVAIIRRRRESGVGHII